jgi:outer membrane protein TolC
MRSILAAAWIVASLAARRTMAQGPAGGDSLRLGTLQNEAIAADPRARQLQLQAAATDLRLRNIGVERLPTFNGLGQLQYQSAVTSIEVPIPGIQIPTPPHYTYDAHVDIRQSVLDLSRRPRTALERAQLVEAQAQVRVALFPLRQEVNDAFFSALLLQERQAQVDAAIVDLGARLAEMRSRFEQGAALPSDTALIVVTILQRRQEAVQLRNDRAAALARLADVTKRRVSDSAAQPLAVPELAPIVGAAFRAIDERRRPEYAQFEATRERLAAQSAVQAAQERPRLSMYGRVGYALPGLDVLNTSAQSYWIAGAQVQWTPFTWGSVAREREAFDLQRDIATASEAAFTNSLSRAGRPLVATMARLDSTLALDEQIVVLREQIEREAAVRLREAAITAAEFVDRSSELTAARLLRAQHRVELAQARANYLTLIGVDVP